MTETERKKLENTRGNVHRTESFGAVDGPGVRFVFFLQGCAMRCLYCHNPDSLSLIGGVRLTAKQAAFEAMRYKSYIKSGGVTFSGGEPLLQPDFVYAVTRLLKENGVPAAIDTAGCVNINAPSVKAAVDECALVLLDIKASDDQTAKALTGHDLGSSYAMLDYCEKTCKPVWIRHVLISGFTLDNEKLESLAKKLKPYRCIELIELLPFHKLGEHKWADTKFEYKLTGTPATDRNELEKAKEIFAKYGFKVQ